MYALKYAHMQHSCIHRTHMHAHIDHTYAFMQTSLCQIESKAWVVHDIRHSKHSIFCVNPYML